MVPTFIGAKVWRTARIHDDGVEFPLLSQKLGADAHPGTFLNHVWCARTIRRREAALLA